MSNFNTLAPTYVQERLSAFSGIMPTNDGVSFRRQATSRGYPPPGFEGPPRSSFPFHHVYRDFPTQGGHTAPIEPQVEYTLDGDVNMRRRPLSLLPGPPMPADYGSLCRNRYGEQIYDQFPFDLVAQTHTESFSAPHKRPKLSPIVIDIRDTKKETFSQQNEAVSPGGGSGEQRSHKDELLQGIKRLEHNINQLETQAANLSKKQLELEAAASQPTDVETTTEAPATLRMNIAQRIYSENRKKAFISSSILGDKFDVLPVYYQTIDIPALQQIRKKFVKFKYRLATFFKRRHREQQRREDYLIETYATLMHTWIKKLDRRDNGSRRSKEAKIRDFFEKQFPELKKQREDKERFSRVGQRIRSDAELEEILDGLTEQENEDKKMRSLAVAPPMMLPPHQRSLCIISNNGLIEDLASEYKARERALTTTWSNHEKVVFRDKFLQHPKAFVHIASSLERKSVADCVKYYYLTKKAEQYKQLLRKNVKRRTRALVKPAQPQVSRQQEETAKTAPTSTTTIAPSAMESTEKTLPLPISANSIAQVSQRESIEETSGGEEIALPKEEVPDTSHPPFEAVCYACKTPLGDYLKEENMGSQIVCPPCRIKSVRRCDIPTCKTPRRKVKRLRPIPAKWAELQPEIMKELQISASVTRCCSACFNRLSRKFESSSDWPEADIEALKTALRLYGTNWSALAAAVQHQEPQNCRAFYMRNKHSLGLEAYVNEFRSKKVAGDNKSEDEESGETTSSCDEDNCASDTASAPSPIEGTSAEKEDAMAVSIERPREDLKTDNDSSATVSADEGQPATEDKFVRPAVPAPEGKEERTCVRDLIFQAIEMSLQGGPGSAVPKKPSTPPAAHRPTEVIPIPTYADQSEDSTLYQVQDLSKKSSKPLQDNYSAKSHPFFARPAESNIRAYAPQYGPPPPAHFNNRVHDYGDPSRQDGTFYVHSSSSADKIYERAPPHLIAQVPTAKTPPLHKSKVPPVPPLTKLQHKGSITQGTPNAIHYEGGSITLGTPVQNDLKRNPHTQMELYEKPEPIPRQVYDSAVVEQYYTHTHKYMPPYSHSHHPFATKIPFSNESQLSSKQIMIDFNTSKQMQMRRSSTSGGGDKESMLRASPRSRGDQPFPPTHYGMYLTPDSRMAASPETTRQNVIQRWGSKQPSVIQSAPRPLPPTCHEAFNALVNAAAAQPNLNLASMQKDEKHPLLISGISRPEGLERSLLDMHQRPRTYADSPQLNSSEQQYTRVEAASKQHYIQPSNSNKDTSEIHFYNPSMELGGGKQKFPAESSHPSLRIAGMREPFSREQFERQMRQDMGVAPPRPGHDLSFNMKEDERRKATKAEEKHYQQQQVELDNEASRIFSQSFQKDNPKTTTNARGITAANLIDAIITRQINQSTDGTKSDMFNCYQRSDQRSNTPSQPKRKTRDQVVTIDIDEPEKERISFTHNEQRPERTLGEHIASIISKDYSAPNEMNSQPSYFSHSRPLENTITSTIHRESPHILAASTHSPLDSLSHAPQEIQPSNNNNVDHSSQNCPGKGWKLRNALQQNKETDSRDRNIIQTPSQQTPPPQGKASSKSPIATYIVEPISPPTSTPTSEQQSSCGEQQSSWRDSSTGLPSLLPAAPRLYETPTGLQLSPLDYVKNRIVEVMRTQDTPKTSDEKVASSTMPHLEEPARYLEPRESPRERFSPYMSKQADSKLANNWSTEGRTTPLHFRSLSPEDQRPRKKFKTGEYTTPENSSDKLPESTSDQNYVEGSGPRCESSHGSEASSEQENLSVAKLTEGGEEVEQHHSSRIEPVSPPTQTSEAGPTNPYSLVSSSSSPAAGYVSYPYPYSALTVRCLPLPPSTSLHHPSTPATISASPPNEPQPAPLLSSQYEPLSDED